MALTGTLAVFAVAVPVLFVRTRRKIRVRKNYERGLKMVPLLMHLPPLSEDTVGSGRDERDIAEENISRAQVIYSIIASTLKKGGFKTGPLIIESLSNGDLPFLAAQARKTREFVENLVRN